MKKLCGKGKQGCGKKVRSDRGYRPVSHQVVNKTPALIGLVFYVWWAVVLVTSATYY